MFAMDKGLPGNAIMTETAGALSNIFSDNHQLARDRYNLLEALLRDILLLAETFALTRGGSYISVRDLVDAYKVVRRPFSPVTARLYTRDVFLTSTDQSYISVSDSSAKFFSPPKLSIDTFYSFYKGRQPLIPQNPPIADIISTYGQFTDGVGTSKESTEEGLSHEAKQSTQESVSLVPTITPELSFLVKEVLYHAENSTNDNKSYMLRRISNAQFEKVSNALPQHLILLIESSYEQGDLTKLLSNLKVLLTLILPYGTHFVSYLNILIPLMIKLSAVNNLTSDLNTGPSDTDFSAVLSACELFEPSDIAKLKALALNAQVTDSSSETNKLNPSILAAHKHSIMIRQLSAFILSHLAMLALTFDPHINEKIGSVLINTFIKNSHGICSWGLISALTAVSSNNCIGLFIDKLLVCPERDTLVEVLRKPSLQYSVLGLDGGWTLLKESVRSRIETIQDLTGGEFVDGTIKLFKIPLSVLVDFLGADFLS
ncbi:Hypothetical protein GLP15_4445 [Giardia lamblia P15]|uniref:Uncharacterized protein n=1 Tax=Giardia intestinalis (strain P15) TaxID=658858 RepID=E1F5L2_GIAIA|nr:Hypothetical protein GLP15_4445 [Giardia lamblia P15]